MAHGWLAQVYLLCGTGEMALLVEGIKRDQ